MTSKQKFTSFASVLSKNIIRRTALVFIIALVAVTIVSLIIVYNQSSQNARSSLNNSKLEIEKVLSSVSSIADAFAMSLPQFLNNDEFIEELTRDVVNRDDKIVSCAIAYEPFLHRADQEYFMVMSNQDTTGMITTEVMGSYEYDYFYQDWYQIPKLTGKSYWNEPSYSVSGTSTIASYTVPIFDIDGIFIGVFRMDLDLSWLADIADQFKPYESAITLIVSKSGTYVTHVERERILNETIYTGPIEKNDSKRLSQCIKMMSGGLGSTSYPADGRMRYVVYTSLENGWTIMGICSYNDFFSAVTTINLLLFTIAFLGLIILYISSKKIIKRLTKSITEVTYSAVNMSRGNFHARIPNTAANGEIQQLELSMKYLQNTVNEYFSLLKTATAEQERIESELAIANSIQMSFLPRKFKKNPGYDCYGAISPAKEVGGDLFYVRKELGKYLYFAVGDVSGKGVPAALFMAVTKSSFNFFKNADFHPQEIIYKINNIITENNSDGMFVTLFSARVNLETMEMDFCNGGHNPLVIVNPDGTARYLHALPNLAVGLFPDFPYEGETVQLEKGCRIIAYTDGVSEAENKQKDLYGEDRLLEFASNIPQEATAKEVVDSLFDSVHKFANGNDQNDDITIFSVNFDK